MWDGRGVVPSGIETKSRSRYGDVLGAEFIIAPQTQRSLAGTAGHLCVTEARGSKKLHGVQLDGLPQSYSLKDDHGDWKCETRGQTAPQAGRTSHGQPNTITPRRPPERQAGRRRILTEIEWLVQPGRTGGRNRIAPAATRGVDGAFLF
jgi:hypothetical protein